jgi:hypothetical protein
VKTPGEDSRRPSAASLAKTFAGALACAGLLVALAFSVEATLGRPKPLVRVAAATPAAAGRVAIVSGTQVLDGRRLQSVCHSYRPVEQPPRSLVELSDGTMLYTDPYRVADSTGKRVDSRERLAAALAGCSVDVVRMLRQQIEPHFGRGEPVSLIPAVWDGIAVYSIVVQRGSRSIALYFDRPTLSPVGMRIWDQGHVGWSRLTQISRLVLPRGRTIAE